MSDLVIVESPAKAKTIQKYLGKGYKVVASMGHVRDLPKSKLGVDTEHDFAPQYTDMKGKEDVISDLKKCAKKSGKVYLATDPDREGEAISWHIAQMLKLDMNDNNRVAFNEITKTGVQNGMGNPDKIDVDLVSKIKDGKVMADQGIIAGCSGGTYDNLSAAASILRGQSVGNDYFTISAYPQSTPVYMATTRSGIAEELLAGEVAVDKAHVLAVPGRVLAVDLGVVDRHVLALPEAILGRDLSVVHLDVLAVLEDVLRIALQAVDVYVGAVHEGICALVQAEVRRPDAVDVPEGLVGIVDAHILQREPVHLAEKLGPVDHGVLHSHVVAVPDGGAAPGREVAACDQTAVHMPPRIFAVEFRVVALDVLTEFDARLAVRDYNVLQTRVAYAEQRALTAVLLVADSIHIYNSFISLVVVSGEPQACRAPPLFHFRLQNYEFPCSPGYDIVLNACDFRNFNIPHPAFKAPVRKHKSAHSDICKSYAICSPPRRYAQSPLRIARSGGRYSSHEA